MTLLRRLLRRVFDLTPNHLFMGLQAEVWRKQSICHRESLKSCGENTNVAHNVFISVPEKMSVGDNCFINEFVHILAGGDVTIGNGVYIANHVSIVSVLHPTDRESLSDITPEEEKNLLHPVIIEDYVWLGSHVVVLPGVRLGRSCIVGAGSVVTRDIPPYAIAVGSPAKVMRYKEIKHSG